MDNNRPITDDVYIFGVGVLIGYLLARLVQIVFFS